MDNNEIASEMVFLRQILNEPDRFAKLAARITTLAAAGWKQQELLDLLENLRPETYSEVDEDIVSVMDCVGGYCSPGALIKTVDYKPWSQRRLEKNDSGSES